MRLFLLFLLLLIAVVVEATLIQLPFVLLVLFVFAVIYRSEWVFPIAFLAGLLLDGLSFRVLGSSSLFFMIFFFLVFLYERKFELRSIWFVMMMSCVGSVLFFLIFGFVQLFPQIIISVFCGTLLFALVSFLQPMPRKDTLSTWKK